MDKSIALKKGKHIHYFKQPESKPVIVVVVKRKKAGLDMVYCRELDSKSKRWYTIAKLEEITKKNKKIMNDYNTAPKENEQYKESRSIYYKIGKNTLICDLEFKGESDGTTIYPERDTFSISKIELFTKVSGFSLSIDLSELLIDFIGQDHLLNILEKTIESSFTGGCYELV